MLEFFRRYQRYFMAVVALVIIFSFSFFGTYGSMGSFEKPKDFVVARAIDGSDLLYSEVRDLSQLLEISGPSEVFKTTFLNTRLGERLFSTYYEALKDEWAARLAKARGCRFYTHPSMKYLDAKNVWSHLAPGLLEEIDALQQYEEGDPKFFSQWAKVYSLQESIPPEMVQRILLYQQSEAGLPPDERLVRGDFSLFGCKTLRDWFGKDFLSLSAQFLLNGAILANQEGYRVSSQEARADLKRRLANASLQEKEVEMLTSKALPIWKKILGFLNWFEEVGQSALSDSLPLKKVHELSNQKASIDLYSLPKELQFSSIEDLIAYEAYCYFACKGPQDLFSFPQEFLPVSEVKKSAPELTASTYQVRFSQIDPMELAGKLSLQEVWSWQMQDDSWDRLCKRFVQIEKISEPAKRFSRLEKLDSKLKRRVDEWSRLEIIQKDLSALKQALQTAKRQEAVLTFTNQKVEGISIQNAALFEELLSKAVGGDEQALKTLEFYRESDQGFCFFVESVKQIDSDSIVLFSQAKQRGQIPTERFLEERYSRIRSRYPKEFQTAEGKWAALSEVRDRAIEKIFSELFQKIDEREGLGKWDRGKGPFEFYASRRFSELMRRAVSSFQKNEPVHSGIWKLVKQDLVIEKSNSEEWMQKEPFIVDINSWSPIYVPPNGEIAFFYLKNREFSQEPVLDRIHFGRESLAREVQSSFADELLDLALQNEALVLPFRIEGEENDDL